jgi:hypothetical protein
MSDTKCINEQLGRKLFRLAFRPGNTEDLDSDLREHLAECPFCRLTFPTWKKKGYFANRMAEARSIILQAQSPDSSIEKRHMGSKTIYFKPLSEKSTSGVMIVTNTDGSIVQIDDVTRGVFLTTEI